MASVVDHTKMWSHMYYQFNEANFKENVTRKL